jgi:septal ring factor EnvC (AmiA/AmiB activator)
VDLLAVASQQRLSDNVQISIISAISGIVIAYIVNVMAKKVQETKAKKQPKDRMEQMFDGYERLIKQKDLEDDRKQRYIKVIEDELTATKLHVGKLEEALERTNDQLVESRKESKDLHAQLNEMRREYKTVKHSQ